ncbi:Spc98 family-domain-containing protein [Mycena amicta]|nr:Spc98 family-domain-containing protein [Mycena amicta]
MLPSSSGGLSVNSNALSQRPPSSASRRPISSLSNRPLSSASVRPISRLSQRPHSRHARSRLLPTCQSLVTQLTGLRDDDDGFQNAVEYAVKSLESTTITKAATSVDMGTIDRQVYGHAQKARINSRDALAEAFETCYQRLKHQAAQDKDLDQEIQMSRLPDHMRFLISLSSSSSSATVAFAETYLDGIKNPPLPPPEPTWAEIFGDEEPDVDSSSSPSLSSLDSDDLDLDDEDDTHSSLGDEADAQDVPLTPNPESSRPPHTYAHRKQFEQLRARQYWRDDYVWGGDPKGKARAFDLGDASTLAPAIQRAIAEEKGALDALDLNRERYIDEQDAVREMLIALQGRKNVMVSLLNGSYEESASTPRLIHLSPTAQSSLISDITQIATIAHHLRAFVAFVFQSSQNNSNSHVRSPRMTRTLEAFADAVDAELRQLDRWCAEQEEAICRIRTNSAPPNTKLVVSLLRTQKMLQDTFEDGFGALLSVVEMIAVYEYRRYALLPRTPAALSALLLDTLLEKVQVYREREERVTADMLMRVFVGTAEPVWAMVGRWLKNGMGLGGRPGDQLQEEFFIEGSGLTVAIPGIGGGGLLDPDFWAEGYVLRDGVVRGEADDDDEGNARAIPSFLEHVASPVLGSGKAVGLLRALGFLSAPNGPMSLLNWRSFSTLLASGGSPDVSVASQQLTSISVDTLSQLIYEELERHCDATGALLGRILIEECELLRHLGALEDLFFMRRGDAMTNFTDVLFAKMDGQQAWGDFHFLNSAFRDVVESGGKEWIQASLVRLSYRGSKDGRSVKVLSGLLVEYAVPFPIAYVFPPRVLQAYGEIFVFLLQIRRSKALLERILVRGAKVGIELKTFYAFRSRLSWFINTFLNFLTTQVIHAQVTKFHENFAQAKSLDEMIKAHGEHIDKVHRRCLLGSNTAALHRAIISALDMSLHFCEVFTTFTGNTTVTLDVSRHSIISRRHRSRRQRAQRKNVVSFSMQQLPDSDESSEEDEEDEIDLEDGDRPELTTTSFSLAEPSMEDGFGIVDKMSSELDGLVRFVRRGVESLTGGAEDASTSFSVLAFALEDWDL